jgi:hypothetical protein
MADKKIKKTTTVHEHPMHVPFSKINPTDLTTRHQHKRRVYTSTSAEELNEIFANYSKNKINYPSAGRLTEFKNSDQFDELIAVWCDYFNQKFPPTTPEAPLDPNIIKDLIASESSFNIKAKNGNAYGIAQITTSTLKTLQDPDGEAKDFLFKDIRQKDLYDPEIAIPLATRWLFRKKATATNRLGHSPSTEELILEYKGLTKSSTSYKKSALINFKDAYEKLLSKK